MLATNNSDPQHQSLQITHDDKFYSRLLSKETSIANLSFRSYYGRASSAVPFLWESQPGTPKSTTTSSTLPPLTPSPSYHSSAKTQIRNAKKPLPRVNSLMQRILSTRLAQKKTNSHLISPSVSSSGSSGSRSRFSSPQSSFDDAETADEGSPTSTLTYRLRHDDRNGRPKGCYSMVIMKSALLSVVRSHGCGQGTAA